MGNPFENLTINPRENLSTKEPVAGEFDVEASEKDTRENPKREKTKELLELTLSAKREAERILKAAYGVTGEEGIKMQLDAYKIYAALIKLEVELPQNIINTTERLIKKGVPDKGIAGFSSEESAKNFLKGVVGNTEDVTETTEQAMVA